MEHRRLSVMYERTNFDYNQKKKKQQRKMKIVIKVNRAIYEARRVNFFAKYLHCEPSNSCHGLSRVYFISKKSCAHTDAW